MPFVRVQVPSSTTNLGPGFDALGVALNLYNRVELDELPWGLSIHVEGEGVDVIPCDETNISVEAVKRVYKKAGRTLPGLWMKQRNHTRISLGSQLRETRLTRIRAKGKTRTDETLIAIPALGRDKPPARA